MHCGGKVHLLPVKYSGSDDHDLREEERVENCRAQDFVSLTKPTVLYIHIYSRYCTPVMSKRVNQIFKILSWLFIDQPSSGRLHMYLVHSGKDKNYNEITSVCKTLQIMENVVFVFLGPCT